MMRCEIPCSHNMNNMNARDIANEISRSLRILVMRQRPVFRETETSQARRQQDGSGTLNSSVPQKEKQIPHPHPQKTRLGSG